MRRLQRPRAGWALKRPSGPSPVAVGAGEDTPIGGIFAKFSERVGLNDGGVIAFHGMLKFAPVEAAIFAVAPTATGEGPEGLFTAQPAPGR